MRALAFSSGANVGALAGAGPAGCAAAVTSMTAPAATAAASAASALRFHLVANTCEPPPVGAHAARSGAGRGPRAIWLASSPRARPAGGVQLSRRRLVHGRRSAAPAHGACSSRAGWQANARLCVTVLTDETRHTTRAWWHVRAGESAGGAQLGETVGTRGHGLVA